MSLAGRLGGENVGDLRVGRGLPADGALDGPPTRAHAVLLQDDGDALVAEAVPTGQHGPLAQWWGNSHPPDFIIYSYTARGTKPSIPS